MRDAFHHEILYRGEEALARLAAVRLAVCGAGAVGSNLVDNLVRHKVEILQSEVFRAVGVEIGAVRKRLTDKNVSRLLRDADLL